ncbi:hypothetical protein ACS0TY_003246 [Phlomoides rotata]
MLQLFFAVAFSAVPLTLYIPSIRNLTRFVEIMEHIWRDDATPHTNTLYPLLRHACTGIFNCLLCATN